MNKLIFLMVFGILLIAGCSQQSQTGTVEKSDKKPTELKTAVCGNGIKEDGEISDICCQDAGCPLTFKCNSKFEGNKTTFFCQKIEKKDTFESSKIKQLMEDIGVEINKEDEGLRDYNKVRDKLSEINKYLSKLNELGYDSKTEEYMYAAAKARSEVSEIRTQTYKVWEEKTFEQQKTAISKDLEDVSNIVQTLESLKSIYTNNLEEAEMIYTYNIDKNLDTWKNYKVQLEKLKESYEKGIKIELSLIEVDTTCFSTTGYVNKIKLKADNTGGFNFNEPRFDVSLYSNGQLVQKKSDNSIFDDLKAGQVYYLEVNPYISGLECKTYDLQLDMRDGPGPTVYGTVKGTFTLD